MSYVEIQTISVHTFLADRVRFCKDGLDGTRWRPVTGEAAQELSILVDRALLEWNTNDWKETKPWTQASVIATEDPSITTGHPALNSHWTGNFPKTDT